MRLDIASCLATILWVSPLLLADDKLDVKAALERSIIEPPLPLREVQAYVESHVPPMPDVKSVAEWEPHVVRRQHEETRRRDD